MYTTRTPKKNIIEHRYIVREHHMYTTRTLQNTPYNIIFIPREHTKTS